ncbi:SEL1-like repeat protein [Alsobacter sp. SYSU M60028]|uniref:SEL1-like repeat protein n=1 Tax=Alsobacter ponti TaxID=2962936 RepID=A0ABT1LHJ1_9HYPH|nr:SEL1-like repeat protein [Alsobacter ponti]MCP8940160.1 SEL1-like repeat protein [Alsobacter ponti]
MRRALPWLLLALAGVAPAAAQNVLRPDATPGAPTLSATPEPVLPGGPTAYARRPGAYGPVTDLAYGAFQRGLYLTAFREASKRIETDPSDGAAMTLIGELYANGYGVRQDWTKAGEWYRLAAARGDAQGAFALAMLTLDGRGVAKDPAAGRRLLESAAPKTPAAAYNLGLLLLAENTPQSDARAIDLFRRAAESSEPEAQYAMGVLFKQGRGVQRDPAQAAMWLSLAAENHNGAAMVEYAIMLFNGEGVTRDETAGAKMFRRAAELGNPVAQNRLARIYAAGRGLPKDLVAAAKWHQLASARGMADQWLDDALRGLTPAERDRAEDAARRWLDGFG